MIFDKNSLIVLFENVEILDLDNLIFKCCS